MTRGLPLLVFSDLDGTLLDHQSYSWRAARPGLDRLKELGAGLVLASSKTAAEMVGLRRNLGLEHFPAIVENGAGLLWPGQPGPADAGDYPRIRKIVTQLPPGFIGFADMSNREVADITGLSLGASRNARDRRFSEPGVWTGTPEALRAFLDAAARHGLHARQGGRFLTLSFGKTKADAMAEITKQLNPVRTIALGDAPNDLEMILAADTGVIIANRHGAPFPALRPEDEHRIMRTILEGPKGWSEAILTLTAEP
ncbi:HAD hydrolase family protein [Primorskyibacter aestuariivivens]|uniref:HAD-IIB family hydrolase n=1 Tax=Primorskyibacter aestuariivivens TaxID=1888912 RepID=UPI0023000054|nr:HAD hydrolase family protein [Primorskyibacter aestuariivivens]MDA7429720.1 HAD hydrolase family protein [Primorskyibacter aestuariivivens]